MSSEAGPENGIQYYGRVEDIKVYDGKVRFKVESWHALKKVIRPVGYGIQSHMMTMALLEQS